MADSNSKTEKATPKKRRDERKKGNVFLSKDAVTVVSLITSIAVLRVSGPGAAIAMEDFLRFCISGMATTDVNLVAGNLNIVLYQGLYTLLKAAGPLMAACVVACVAATMAQTKLLVAGDSLKPKFERINPIEGFKKLFSLRSVVEALKGTLKIAVLLLIIFDYISGMVTLLANYINADLGWVCRSIFEETFGMVTKIAIAFTALAAFDFFYQWWDYEKKLKMSKQEIKEEYKQMEGDPQIKGKIKEMQRKMAQKRMMQQVPQADVVIRNPNHFAVALRYKPERDHAPLVLAKGMDELALRIVKMAEEHKVAVIENVPLARALYAEGELGHEIPPALYGAVAEVLVYLYQLKDKKMP